MGAYGFDVDKHIITLAPNESEKISANVMNGFNVYADEKDKIGTLKITSSNTDIARVDAEGNIIGVKPRKCNNYTI